MPKRLRPLWLIPIILLLLLGCFSLFGTYSKIATSIDNTPTRGTVLQVGRSSVSPAPYTITYAFDVPGYPRNGNSGSFTREQITTKKEMARFKAGMKVDVERSKLIPGASRIKGFGQGSVLWHELRGEN